MVSLQVNFLKYAGSLGVLPHREVIDVLLQRAEHLAPGFECKDASTVLKAVAGWGGAGTTTHGAALMEALHARASASSAPARFTRIGWPSAAASSPPSALALSHTPMMSAANLTARLKTSKSAADICRLGGHIKDMNQIHLNVGAAPQN